MKFALKVGEKEYKIEILEGEEDEVIIKINEKVFSFKEKEEKRISLNQTFLPERRISKEILAPIAGVVSEIFVKEGDYVKNGQRLLLLSAMKMENEIHADSEGTIKKIFVERKQSVKKDQKLIEIE